MDKEMFKEFDLKEFKKATKLIERKADIEKFWDLHEKESRDEEEFAMLCRKLYVKGFNPEQLLTNKKELQNFFISAAKLLNSGILDYVI